VFTSRRTFGVNLIAIAVGFSLLGARTTTAQDVDTAALATPVPLGDIVIGSANAPVTMIEYASLSCGHCAAFHESTYPTIKAEYIDTGKVRYIFREYPLDVKAAAA
jgi:protein-disulfide isomerase